MSEKHLKPHQYYSDLYDRGTVDQCRRIERLANDKEDPEPPTGTRISKRQTKRIKKYVDDLFIRIRAGERYLNRSQAIREWMDRDQKKDELYESAQAPEDIRCLTCRNRMKPTFKELWTEHDKNDRVLFMYDCPNKCMPRRTFFSDGEEWRSTPKLCLRCSTPLKHDSQDDGKKLTTTYTCTKCGYIEKDEYVWTHKKDEFDENFAKDRDRFCMTAEEGGKYQDEKWQTERLAKFSDEWKEEEKVRDEKLKQNPKGFHLEGSGRRCAICGDSTHEGDNWYDQWGVKCLVCQKAIDNGEIPPELAKYQDTWYTKHDLESDFGVKAPALRRWIKDGIIRPRTITHYGTGIHTQIFLMRDNKNLLPPKKLLKGHSVDERGKDGKIWSHSEPWYRFVDPFKHLKRYRIMRYLRVVPPEEVKTREEEEKKKWEEKRARRELKKKNKKNIKL